MVYRFKYTEKNVSRGSEYETRALLFLLSFSAQKEVVHYLFIDCFNDVSGSGENCHEIYDIQSKGVQSLTPNKIGKFLVTLFENYRSNFSFSGFALFIPPIDPKYTTDPNLNTFAISNFGKNQSKVRDGLKKEFKRRNPDVMDDQQLDSSLDGFLKEIHFILDKNTKEEYVKSLTNFKNSKVKETAFYNAIFEEIQGVQLSKKRINIEAAEISKIQDALKFNKHLSSKDIQTLLINRLIGVEVFKDLRVPIYFIDRIKDLDTEERKDLIQECNSRISKALFDKNSKLNFWNFLETAIELLRKNPGNSPSEIYSEIEKSVGIKSSHMRNDPGMYLIALIKEGLENDIY